MDNQQIIESRENGSNSEDFRREHELWINGQFGANDQLAMLPLITVIEDIRNSHDGLSSSLREIWIAAQNEDKVAMISAIDMMDSRLHTLHNLADKIEDKIREKMF